MSGRPDNRCATNTANVNNASFQRRVSYRIVSYTRGKNFVAGKWKDEYRDYRYASVSCTVSKAHIYPIWREKGPFRLPQFRVLVAHWMPRPSCRSCFDSCCSNTSATFIRKWFSAETEKWNRISIQLWIFHRKCSIKYLYDIKIYPINGIYIRKIFISIIISDNVAPYFDFSTRILIVRAKIVRSN